MKKTLKIVAIVLGALVLLLLAAVIILPLIIDPNDYRDDIAGTVEQHTGREVRIPGDIRLSVFPWLGVELGRVEMGNAAGFDGPFAHIEGLDVRVRLLPLLRGQLEADTIGLRGLNLHLVREADGRTNWDDLVPAEPAAEETPAEPGGPNLGALAISGLDVREARIRFEDRQAGQDLLIEDLTLASGAVTPDRPFPIELSLQAVSREPELRGRLAFAGRVTISGDLERLRLQAAEAEADLHGPLLPSGRLAPGLKIDELLVDLGREALQVTGLQLRAAGVEVAGSLEGSESLAEPELSGKFTLTVRDGARLMEVAGVGPDVLARPAALNGGSVALPVRASLREQTLQADPVVLELLDSRAIVRVQGRQILTAPTFSGRFSAEQLAPRALAERLGVSLPEMSDATALSSAALRTAFEVSPDSARLDELALSLDQTNLTGKLAVEAFEPLALRFDLAVDGIDVDRYLPPEQEPAPATPAAAAAGGASALPLDLLRSLRLDGRLQLAELKVMGLQVNQVQMRAGAQDGQIRLHPFTASLYQGRYQGDSILDVRQDEPVLRIRDSLAGVQIGPLLHDFMEQDRLQGATDLKVNLTARGLDPDQIRRTLSGELNLLVKDGAVKGINIAKMIREGYARYKGQPAQQSAELEQTDFSSLSASVQLDKGIARNQDLDMKSPLLRVTGKGQVNLVEETLDYNSDVVLVGTLKGQQGEELTELRGVRLPLEFRGTFEDPKIRLAVDRVLRERIKREADERLEREKGKLEEKLRERQPEVEEQLRDKLRNLLKR